MSVTFTNELVLQLIQVYKNYPLLWDTSNRHSKDKVKKNDAWEDIAKIMNISRREVESKIHTLRSQFAREKKKIALLRKNGRDDVKDSSWFAYEPMKFLLKGDTDGLDNSELQIQQNSNDQFPEIFQAESFNNTAPMHYESTETTTPPPSSSKTHNSRKRTISYDEKSDDTMGVYNFPKPGQSPPKSSLDEFEIYAQYVASELRETKDVHSVLVAKHYINSILFNARMGKYRRGASTSNVHHRRASIKSERDVYILDGMPNNDE